MIEICRCEKPYETLTTREERLSSDDIGNYFRDSKCW